MKKIFLLVIAAALSLACSSQVIRYATAADVLQIHNASVGDLLITGANQTSNGLPAIYVGMTDNFPLSPGKKILIKGGNYDYVILHSTSSGTSSLPIVITNYDGQVKSRAISIKGLKYFKLTGKYDYNRKTGDLNFLGHSAGYAWSQGKYGIFVDNAWTNENRFLLEITGYVNGTDTIRTTNYEVEYVESGNGGFSNVFKFNNQTGIVDSVKIHDVYFHDTDGEGIYLGNTSGSNQEVFKNLQFYNNRLIRTGNDGLQLNKVVDGSKIYNNVIVNGGMGWRDPFMGWQDLGCSLGFNNGNVEFRKNLVVGGAVLYQSFLSQEPTYSVVPSGNVTFQDNLFSYSKHIGVFLGPENGNLIGVSQVIQNNYFSKFEFLYDQAYNVSNAKYVYNSYYSGNVRISDNAWDSSGGENYLLLF